MSNINNIQKNKKSYKFDHFSNIIAENVDDLLYDRFYFNEEHKSMKKSKKSSHKHLNENSDSEEAGSMKKKIKKRKIIYNFRNMYISKDIENERYKKFIKNNKKILEHLKNIKRNLHINDKNNENIYKNNSCQNIIKNDDENEKNNIPDMYTQFKKLNLTSVNNNRSLYNKNNSFTFFDYNQENSKYNNNSRDITINIYNKHKNYFLINNINYYNFTEKRHKIPKKYQFSNKLAINTNYYKLNLNNNYIYNIKKKKRRRNKYTNINNLVKENNVDDENKSNEDNLSNYNFVSFSYPKNRIDNIKHYFSKYDYMEKHCRDVSNCPICQANFFKTSLKEKEMGVFKENIKDKIKSNLYKKKLIAKKYYIRNKEKYNKINKIIYSSKIQQYKKQFCFFNATKGIQKSNSSNEIKSLRYAQTNKNSSNKKNIASDSPIILYYFK